MEKLHLGRSSASRALNFTSVKICCNFCWEPLTTYLEIVMSLKFTLLYGEAGVGQTAGPGAELRQAVNHLVQYNRVIRYEYMTLIVIDGICRSSTHRVGSTI